MIRNGSEEPKTGDRASLLDPHRDEILRLIAACKGNLVRVHEELAGGGVIISYSALADHVRKHCLGKPRPQPSGRYDFGPGEEMQFDTSPHRVRVADVERVYQCASIILCFSRMLYAQYYRRFTRLEAKTFLTAALCYFGGAAHRCMVDNTNLVVMHGTGAVAVMAPEMAAFAERFGFVFTAHAIGDANRSARVERQFHHIENSFLPGRNFRNVEDLNRQAAEFCDRSNHAVKRHLKASPVELFSREQPMLAPLPQVIPEVYRVEYRTVDVEGYVHVGGNTYSVPYELIGKDVDIRESLLQVRVYVGPREVAAHQREEQGRGARITDKAHRPKRSLSGRRTEQPLPEEVLLRAEDPALDAYVTALRQRAPGRGALPLRRLHRMVKEYPASALLPAVRNALHFGMLDLSRLEAMVLRNLAGKLFPEEPLNAPSTQKENTDE